MKSNQRIELTKRLLQEGLIRLLKHKELDKISITELCLESGINRATFYRHYSLPKDILSDMQKNFWDEFYTSFGAFDTRDASSYIEKICVYLYDRADILRLFIHNNSEDEIVNLSNQMITKLTRIRGEHSPSVQRIDENDIKLITTYLVGGGYYVLRQWLMKDVEKTPHEIAQLFLSFLDYAYAIHQQSIT